MAAEPTPEAIAHSVRFRKVSSRYPRQVADAYREVFGDYALAMEDTDEQVAGVVAAWERGHGMEPRDWPAIGHSEGRGNDAS
jgi:hypothetical protein